MLINVATTKSRARALLLSIVTGCVFVGFLWFGRLGYLGTWFGDCETAIARSTAPGEAEACIKKLERDQEKINADTRKYRLESRLLLRECEELEKLLEETQNAMVELASTAKANGIPAPTEGFVLPEELQSKELVFNRKVVTASRAYEILENWAKDCEAKRKLLESKTTLMKRYDSIVDKLEKNRNEIQLETDRLKNQLKELIASRSLADAEHRLAVVEANVHDVNSGRVGTALKTIENEVAELQASAEVLNEGVMAKAGDISPSDVVNPEAAPYAKIAELWID